MKISEHFTAAEFLSAVFLAKIKARGQNPKRYINPQLIEAAEATRAFFNAMATEIDSDIVGVSMVGNKAGVQTRGLRSPWDKTSGAELSDHKFGFAFDCDVYFYFSDGSKVEADYSRLIELMVENSDYFIEHGITMVEDVAFAPTWLHISIAWTGLDELKVIKP